MMGNFMRFCSDEPLDVLLNPHRGAEADQARAAGASRLQELGIRLTGTESVEEVGNLQDAVEEFETAVEAQGGDLMVDEGPHGRTVEPDRADFVLPRRHDRESVPAFVSRITDATRRLQGRRRDY
ncbi:MAG TPA: hypothetical protein VGM77_09030 [Gemmatimonadales bacterium]|jgi:hypothetical protein